MNKVEKTRQRRSREAEIRRTLEDYPRPVTVVYLPDTDRFRLSEDGATVDVGYAWELGDLLSVPVIQSRVEAIRVDAQGREWGNLVDVSTVWLDEGGSEADWAALSLDERAYWWGRFRAVHSRREDEVITGTVDDSGESLWGD
jgi:hypothetical protein